MGRARMFKVSMLAVLAAASIAACSSNGSTGPTNTSPSPNPTPTATGPAQSVAITPSTGLTDGQNVKVVGTGYTAGKSYGVTECADKGAATGAGDCNLRSIKVGVADASGTVTVTFPAAKGPFGSNNIVCSATQACIVSVATAGSAAPDEVASAPITFAT